MSAPTGHRYAADPRADDDVVTRELEFPEPRFPSGVAVPPAALLTVLLAAAGLLITAHPEASTNTGNVPISPTMAAALTVAASALFGFCTLRALVVKPVRRVRTEVVTVSLRGAPRTRNRPSKVHEIARIGRAVGSQRPRSATRRAGRAPMSAGLMLVAITALWALAMNVAVAATRHSGNDSASSVVTLVSVIAACAVLLILAYVYAVTARPLQHLASQAEAVAAADGRPTPEPVAPQRLDEVGAVAAGLNLLTTAPRSVAGTARGAAGNGSGVATTGRGAHG